MSILRSYGFLQGGQHQVPAASPAFLSCSLHQVSTHFFSPNNASQSADVATTLSFAGTERVSKEPLLGVALERVPMLPGTGGGVLCSWCGQRVSVMCVMRVSVGSGMSL